MNSSQPEMSAQVWLLAVLSSVPAASGSMESGYGLRAAVVEALEAAARSGNSMGLPVGPVFCATLTAFIGGLGVAWLALWLGHLREGPTSAAAETEEPQVAGPTDGAAVGAIKATQSKCPFGFTGSGADADGGTPVANPTTQAEGDHSAEAGIAGASKCPMLGSLLGSRGMTTGLTPDGATRTILLTGASRGIGHGTVKMFAAAGWRVITCSRTAFPRGSPRRGVSSKCPWAGGTVNHVTVDLSDPEDTRLAIQDIKKKLQGRPLHALVNNAAISPKMKNADGSSSGKRMGVADTSLEVWQEVMQVNFYAPVMLVNGLLDELLAAVPGGGGSVVNVTSIVGSRVHPFAGPAYATSKAALSALTREMAAEFGQKGLRVNAISPGEIDTSILSPGTQEIVDREIPMRRLGSVSEVAHAIYFLVSEQSAYVNGTELHINGGQHC
jgi:NAD(P)-dependent dehydrogenase (short-subunit alcohol dehydrogenase family)